MWTASFLLFLAPGAGPGFEPTSSYAVRDVEGFTVRISRYAVETPQDLEPAMALLKLRFSEMARRLPAKALKALQKIAVWVERDDSKFPCMCYHDDVGWLNENGFNPDKENSVELANLKNFVLWSVDQPMMVLHEYAHGYHDLSFGFDDPKITAAYRHAMDQHLYDNVSYYRGKKQKGYAATNPMEYFAELSEALFGYNDFFPFTRPELEAYDPKGFRVVADAWGVK